MASGPAVISLVSAEAVTDERRPKLPEGDGAEASITLLTSGDAKQSQRDSNPCRHLERVNRGHQPTSEYSQTHASRRRFVYFCLRHGTRRNRCFSPGRRPWSAQDG